MEFHTRKRVRKKKPRKMSVVSVDSLCLNLYFFSPVSVQSSFPTLQSLFFFFIFPFPPLVHFSSLFPQGDIVGWREGTGFSHVRPVAEKHLFFLCSLNCCQGWTHPYECGQEWLWEKQTLFLILSRWGRGQQSWLMGWNWN